MYSLDSSSADEVIELADIPRSEPGAPMPRVLADEHRVVLAYICFERVPWIAAHKMTPEEVDAWHTRGGSLIALLTFSYHSFLFGGPNDEAIHGHPLHSRGLHAYGAFEVRHSTWIRRLERMNSVHSAHDPSRYASLRHFIFTFHDSMFECVARGFDVSSHRPSHGPLLGEMQRLLDDEAE